METQMITDRSERSEPLRAVADALTRVLADTYALYFQTQSFHWNVRGPHFPTLHAMFEGQYRELAEAVDAVAERARAVGTFAPTSLAQIVESSRLGPDAGAPGESGMLERLLEGHELLSRAVRDVGAIAERLGDVVTEDLMVQRAAAHEKTAWMLRATLEPFER